MSDWSLVPALERAQTGSYFLGLLFLLTSAFAWKRFSTLRKAQTGIWDTTIFFTGSLLLDCVVRCLTFFSLSALGILDVTVGDPRLSAADALFYEKAVGVMFNMADFISVSTYLLLVLVWVETFQSVRRHWFSAVTFRRKWMFSYLVVSGFLYAAQLVIYLLYVFSSSTEMSLYLLDIAYLMLGIVNLAIPCGLIVLWIVMSVRYAGFPYKSSASQEKMSKLSRIIVVWTVGRLIWGSGLVLCINRGYFTQLPEMTDWAFTMALVTAFLLYELIPFLIALFSDLLSLISFRETFQYRPLPDGPSLRVLPLSSTSETSVRLDAVGEEKSGSAVPLDMWKIDLEDVKPHTGGGGLLSENEHGATWRGRWQRQSVTVKSIPLPHATYPMIEEFGEEIIAISARTLRFPRFFVPFLGVVIQPGGLYIVREFRPLGSLQDLLCSPVKLPWRARINIAKDIATALHLLHVDGVAHGNLSSRCIMIEHDSTPRLAGHGLTTVYEFIGAGGEGGGGGSLAVDNRYGWKDPDASCDPLKADIYSCGVLLWSLATRLDPPPGRLSESDFGQQATDAAVEAGASPTSAQSYGNLVSECLSPSWRLRPVPRVLFDFLRGIEQVDRQHEVILKKQGSFDEEDQ